MDEKVKEVKPRCNAPCIINASGAFHIAFCTEKHGHTGEHSLKTKDTSAGFDVTISWNYRGQVESVDNWAPSLSGRCQTWVQISPVEKMTSECMQWVYGDSPFPVRDICKDPIVGFCCEKAPCEHTGHKRSGIFGPLGVKWRIEW